MTTTITDSKIDFLPIAAPRLGKGSHCAIELPPVIASRFVAGQENGLLVEAFQPDSIASLPDRSPCILVGPSSTGKTIMAASLLAQWSDRLVRQEPGSRLTLTSAAEFSRALTRAIKADDMQRFRQLHRECDGLLLDNLHEFVGKPVAQEEFLATLNHLLSIGRCVVATASDLPLALDGLIRALQSRLTEGLSIPLHPPGRRARECLLQEIVSESALDLDPKSTPAWNSESGNDPTALELKGAILRWSHRIRLQPTPQPSASHAVDYRLDPALVPAINPQDIAKAVCKEVNVTLEQMKGPSRRSSIVRARGLAMLLIRQLTSESYEGIGALFSDRDHSTVMHACKKTEVELSANSDLNRIHDRIRQRFRRVRQTPPPS
jgi:chromosomal replication initiator protein